MVKGITRQVIVIKGKEPQLFDEAIFLVNQHALAQGGISEQALLQEAKLVCEGRQSVSIWKARLFWAAAGGSLVSLFWLLMHFFQ